MNPEVQIAQMRDFIFLTEEMVGCEFPELVETLVEDVVILENEEVDIKPALMELVSKLRNHTENAYDDHSIGIEIGMQRAADMIENLLRTESE